MAADDGKQNLLYKKQTALEVIKISMNVGIYEYWICQDFRNIRLFYFEMSDDVLGSEVGFFIFEAFCIIEDIDL